MWEGGVDIGTPLGNPAYAIAATVIVEQNAVLA